MVTETPSVYMGTKDKKRYAQKIIQNCEQTHPQLANPFPRELPLMNPICIPE